MKLLGVRGFLTRQFKAPLLTPSWVSTVTPHQSFDWAERKGRRLQKNFLSSTKPLLREFPLCTKACQIIRKEYFKWEPLSWSFFFLKSHREAVKSSGLHWKSCGILKFILGFFRGPLVCPPHSLVPAKKKKNMINEIPSSLVPISLCVKERWGARGRTLLQTSLPTARQPNKRGEHLSWAQASSTLPRRPQ